MVGGRSMQGRGAVGGVLTLVAAMMITVLGTGIAGAANYQGSWSGFTRPLAVTATPYGIFVADNGRVQEFSHGGQHFRTYCCWGNQALRGEPSGIAVGRDRMVYVTDPTLQRIEVFASNGTHVRSIGAPGVAGNPVGYLSEPRGIVMSPDGNSLYVADRGRERIDRYSTSGPGLSSILMPVIGSQRPRPWGLAFGPNGNLYVATGQWVEELTPGGQLVRYWGAGGGANQAFTDAIGVAVGDQGRIFVVDSGTLERGLFPGRVQEFTPEGQFMTQWGNTPGANSRLNRPEGIAVLGTNVYIVSANNGRLERYLA
jgi:DNA-binding beta-propeller fold protein YncE